MAHLHLAERAGGRRRPVFVTLTVRHSADLRRDRERLQHAWETLRKWVHRRIGKFTYALVWEATPGKDHLGHVHAHAVVLWPYLPWKDVLAEWRSVLEDPGAFIKLDEVKSTPEYAAYYLAKYVSKGVDANTFTPNLAAEVLDSAYGKRIATTSRGFWKQRRCSCKRCGNVFAFVKHSTLNLWALEVASEQGAIRFAEVILLAPVPAD